MNDKEDISKILQERIESVAGRKMIAPRDFDFLSMRILDKTNIYIAPITLKRLRPELQNETRYRNAFYKEYETGKAVNSPYVAKYVDIKEDTDGLYILTEYVNGCTERVPQHPAHGRTGM